MGSRRICDGSCAVGAKFTQLSTIPPENMDRIGIVLLKNVASADDVHIKFFHYDFSDTVYLETVPWGPFFESPGNVSGPSSYCKISNLAITELFYSHILKMKEGSRHTRSFRGIHFSGFRYRRSKNGFTGPKTFRGFRETGPWADLFNHRWARTQLSRV